MAGRIRFYQKRSPAWRHSLAKKPLRINESPLFSNLLRTDDVLFLSAMQPKPALNLPVFASLLLERLMVSEVIVVAWVGRKHTVFNLPDVVADIIQRIAVVGYQ